ncbi:N-acetylglucosamine-6-phosphate deacetylase [Atopobacter phocae]|uniref:N-acetylglucosamine-6-phosphate deacetylase n=1 Tax=Atopobacter phocae TaxID=136492 RepID=UPI0004724BE5|nr:N-acetylglucosamine-6-phosphate deacetylase [Atopobacter phocae]
MTTFIKAKRFFFPNETKEAGYLPITSIGTFGAYQQYVPEDATIIDYSDYSIAPGLVDTHIHGFLGHDVMDNNVEGLKVMAEGLPSCGVTSWLPTTLTAPYEELEAVCQTIGDHASEIKGAKIRGIFLEGPFFSEKHKGAQNPKYMSDPDTDALDKWSEVSGGLVRKIAIAPERKGSIEFIKHARQQDIFVALGHTDATFDECRCAIEAGANIFVHTYNGMRGLHHREPGVVGAAMHFKEAYDEMICDGMHVHPQACQAVMDAHGRERIALITDCMRAGGLGEGESKLGEFDVIVKDGAARLKESGNLAGSILELIKGVQNVIRWGVATPEEAIHMATLAPAESVNIDDVCGKLSPGYAADFIVIDDMFELQATYLDGKLAYKRS